MATSFSSVRGLWGHALAVSCLLVLGTGIAHGQSGIALVQHTGRDAGTTTSSSLAFAANNTAGNWIGVAIRAGNSNQVFTVGDSRGNTYRKAVQLSVTVDGETIAIYYAENIAAGVNTVSITNSI